MKPGSDNKFKRLALIGVGLIGGSLARALRRAAMVDEIVGCARSEATLAQAVALGVIDRGESDPGDAVSGADLVVIAVPVMSSADVFDAIAPSLAESVVVTDVGSVKGPIIEAARDALGAHFSSFVPGHPIAGTEHSGVAASFAELYDNKHVVLTPLADVTDPVAMHKVTAMWNAVGADVMQMDADEHDQLLAMTSHLPHVLAYALVGHLARHPRARELFELAAAGFYDFTRIASSDPHMWRDICVSNKAALVQALTGYREHIDRLIDTIGEADGDELLRLFQQAKQARDRGMVDKNS